MNKSHAGAVDRWEDEGGAIHPQSQPDEESSLSIASSSTRSSGGPGQAETVDDVRRAGLAEASGELTGGGQSLDAGHVGDPAHALPCAPSGRTQ